MRLYYMIYTFFQKMLARPEYRKFNAFTDSNPSEGHEFNYQLAKPYITNKKVLDVGCWSGQFEKLASKATKKIVGIDPNKEAIAFAKRTIKGSTFLHGSATNLPIENGVFDVVTFFDVLEHIPIHTEIICLKEIHRVLKQKGMLMLCTPYKHFLSIVFDPSFWSQGHRHYGKEEIESMLHKSGFKIRRAFTVGGKWSVIAYIINMIAKHILRIKFNFSKLIRKKLKEEAKQKGIMGIFIIAEKL